MWTSLYPWASPKVFYSYSGRCIPVLAVAASIFLLSGLIWGVLFAPPDYQQGDAFRIIYVHVPAAFLSMGLYACMTFWAVLLLIWRIKMAGVLLEACASLGACMAFLALITGSLWGKPMWGAWWVWDARLTSELILLFLYAAMLAVGHAYQTAGQSDKMMAILTLVGAVDLPVIHYSVYWWNSLHQGATLSLFAKPKMALSMLYPLLLTLVGFCFYCAMLLMVKSRDALLWRERHQRWVKELFLKGDG